MRIVWKDSNKPKGYKPLRYRGFNITGSPIGWTTDIPNDPNIYKSNFHAMNAIDQHFGDFGQRGTEKRKRFGIVVVGRRDEIA